MPIVVIFNDLVPDIYLLFNRYQVNIKPQPAKQIITLHNFNQSCNVVRGKIKSRRCYLIKQRALQRRSHTNLQETNYTSKWQKKGTRQTKGYLSWRQHSETDNCDYKVHHPNLESLNWDWNLFFEVKYIHKNLKLLTLKLLYGCDLLYRLFRLVI